MKTRLLILILLILSANVLSGQVVYNEEFSINDTLQGWQLEHDLAKLSNGNFVVCWSNDYRESGKGDRIFAQILNQNGEKIGDEILLNTTGDVNNDNPAVSCISEDRFIIVWQSYRGSNILGQIFDNEGNKIDKEFQVNSYTKEEQWYPGIEKISSGEAIVYWTNSLTFESDKFGMQIVNFKGEKVGDEVLLSFDAYTDYKIKKMTNDKMIICYNRFENGNYKIGFQFLDTLCNKIGTEFNIQMDNRRVMDPIIEKIANDKFVICWSSRKETDLDWDIFAQIFDENGNEKSPIFQIGTITEYSQNFPSIIRLAGDNFLICWDSYQKKESKNSILMQLYDSEGNKLYSEVQVSGSKLGAPKIERISDDKFVMCYFNSTDYKLYGKYFFTNPVEHELENFEINSPQTDETVNNAKPQFKWQSSYNGHRNFPWDVTYNLYISKNEDFTDPLIYREIEDTKYQLQDTLDFGQIYYWKIQAANWEYDSLWSSNVNGFFISNDAEVAVDNDPITATEFSLHQNYPNPFNPSTMINYQLPITSEVQLVIYNNLGGKVATLVNEKQQVGNYSVDFDATGMSSGIYFYQLLVGSEFVETRKMVFLK